MPHSSGGGSHSGGSHSSSSSSSSSGSSHGGGSSVKTSNTWFAGSHQYVHYKDNGEPEYVFSSSRTLNEPASKLRYLLLIVYIPFFYFLIFMATTVVKVPRRLPDKYDTQIVIEDNINVIEDRNHLIKVFDEFYDETGITMAVITDTNSAWEDYYNSMENYAYDMYVTRFPDESHWLITYTTSDINGFEDWHFEGMQGDDTDAILSNNITSVFNEKLTKYLMQGDDLGRALEKAIADIRSKNLMDIRVNYFSLGIFLIISTFVIFHAVMMIRDPNKKYRNYVMIPDNVKQVAYCEYCNSPYWPQTTLECPNCGAPLTPDTFKTE